MKFSLSCFVLVVLGIAPLSAQTATPARPADPNQAMPAQPVDLTPPTPATPARPATPATPVTPIAPAPAAPAPDTSSPEASGPVALSIAADSSLKKVLQELAQNWADSLENSPQVPLTLTNEATIRSKIEAGSPWDMIISADIKDVKDMIDKGLLVSDSQRSLARNSLAVFGRKALIKDEELDWFDLVGSEWKKVALGNPDTVASGRVAKLALQKHGLINDDTKDVYVYTPNEARAINIVQSEKADAVFAYKTDLIGIKLAGFDSFPMKPEDSPPIFYTAAICRNAKNAAQAQAFILYCASDAARPIWAKYGFETN